MVVIHYTAMQSAEDAITRLCDPSVEVSAHYLIACNGTITQMVDEALRAWHAGAGQWGGCDDINSRSIGIELDNDGQSPFSAALMDALEGLLGEIRARWVIPVHHVIAHSDLAPSRKIDPGKRFDWRRLALGGHAIWPERLGQDAPLAHSLRTLGYGVETFGVEACLDAFRQRFAPMRDGGETHADRREAFALAQNFAVDPWQQGG